MPAGCGEMVSASMGKKKKEIFDNYKIIFPFKASSNKFSFRFWQLF